MPKPLTAGMLVGLGLIALGAVAAALAAATASAASAVAATVATANTSAGLCLAGLLAPFALIGALGIGAWWTRRQAELAQPSGRPLPRLPRPPALPCPSAEPLAEDDDLQIWLEVFQGGW